MSLLSQTDICHRRLTVTALPNCLYAHLHKHFVIYWLLEAIILRTWCNKAVPHVRQILADFSCRTGSFRAVTSMTLRVCSCRYADAFEILRTRINDRLITVSSSNVFIRSCLVIGWSTECQSQARHEGHQQEYLHYVSVVERLDWSDKVVKDDWVVETDVCICYLLLFANECISSCGDVRDKSAINEDQRS